MKAPVFFLLLAFAPVFAQTHVPTMSAPAVDAAIITTPAIRALKADMKPIPTGTFTMGDLSGRGFLNERPLHTVTITRAFSMCATEVTQAQWRAVIGTSPSYLPGDSSPVEMITMDEAMNFCNLLSVADGLTPCYTGGGESIVCNFAADGYRLPTEAEWEWAARAGTTTDYYTGDMTAPECAPVDEALSHAGWYCGNGRKVSHGVGRKQANAYGLYDMCGNVTEMCWDWFGGYSAESVTDPVGPPSGSDRVVRGGSWYDPATIARSSARQNYPQGAHGIAPLRGYGMNGFRVARTTAVTRVERADEAGLRFELDQNHPNPAAAATTVAFQLPVTARTILKVFSITGREVATVVDDVLAAGAHARTWNATGMPQGVYYYRLESGGRAVTRMMLVRP